MKRNLLIFISGAAVIFSVSLANSQDLTKTQRSHSSHSSVAHSNGSYTSSNYSSGYTTSLQSKTTHSAGGGMRTHDHSMPIPDERTPEGSGTGNLKTNPTGNNSSTKNMPQ